LLTDRDTWLVGSSDEHQAYFARRYYEENTAPVDHAMRYYARSFLSGRTTEENIIHGTED
jgi:hypothetical protein